MTEDDIRRIVQEELQSAMPRIAAEIEASRRPWAPPAMPYIDNQGYTVVGAAIYEPRR